jgi:hypothetical protein
LKLRALEERTNLERKTIQSQATAKVSVIHAEHSTLAGKLKSEMEVAMRDLSELLPEGNEPSDFRSAISAITDEFTKLYHYKDLYSEFSGIYQLLRLKPGSRILPHLRQLVEIRENVERKLSEMDEMSKQNRLEREQMLLDIKKGEEQSTALRQWESWGQRIYRMLRNSEAAGARGKDLRFVLEEALLASVAQRSVLSRIQMLRDEKCMWNKFDRRLLTSRYPLRASARPVIQVLAFARRVQRLAGHLPIALGVQAPTQIFMDDFQTRRRKSRSRSVKRADLSHPIISG